MVQEAFASSVCDDALLLLGDLAWERGDLAAARQVWRKLVPRSPDSPVNQFLPVYPDSQLPLAEIRARLILCSLFLEERGRAEGELAAFAQLHGEARGQLAGREGRLIDILRDVARETPAERSIRGQLTSPTVGGSPSRTALLREPSEIGGVRWVSPLPRVHQLTTLDRITPHRGLQPVAHPVVWQDQVFLCDEVSILGWNLYTGSPLCDAPQGRPAHELYRHSSATALQPLFVRRLAGLPQFSVTVAGGRLYARLGSAEGGRLELQRPPSQLVCLDLKSSPPQPVWTRDAETMDPTSPGWSFEGAPLVEDGHVYVALRKSEARAAMAVACCDASTGRPLWLRQVMTGAEPWSARGEEKIPVHSQLLLTLSDGNLYLNTNAGGLCCVTAREGRIRWVASYARQPASSPGDYGVQQLYGVNPMVVEGGRAYAAPTDSQSLLCLDAESGVIRWEQSHGGRLKVVLGAAGSLVFTGGSELWASDVHSGATVWAHRPADPEGAGFGRGVLTEKHLLWPTREELLILDQRTGAMVRRLNFPQERGLPSCGNITLAGGMTVVALPDRLVGLGETSRIRSDLQRLTSERPADLDAVLSGESCQLAEASELKRTSVAAPVHEGPGALQTFAAGTPDAAGWNMEQRAWCLRLLRQQTRQLLASPPGSKNQTPEELKQGLDRAKVFERAVRQGQDDWLAADAMLQLADAHLRAGQADAALAQLHQLREHPRLRLARPMTAPLPRAAAGEIARQNIRQLEALIAAVNSPRPPVCGEPSAKTPQPASTSAPKATPVHLMEPAWLQEFPERRAWVIPERTDADAPTMFLQTRHGCTCYDTHCQPRWSLATAERISWAVCSQSELIARTQRGWLSVQLSTGAVLWQRGDEEDEALRNAVTAFEGNSDIGPQNRRLPRRSNVASLGRPSVVPSSDTTPQPVRITSQLVGHFPPEQLVVLAAEDGSVAWNYAFGADAIVDVRVSSPGQIPEIVALRTDSARVHFLEAATGTVLDELDSREGRTWIEVTPLAGGWWGLVAQPTRLMLAHPATRRRVDYQGGMSSAHGSPVWLPHPLGDLLLKDRESLATVDVETGHDHWSARVGTDLVEGDSIPFGIWEQMLCTLAEGIVRGRDVATGRLQWERAVGSREFQGELRPFGSLIAVVPRSGITCQISLLDPQTGEFVQVFDMPYSPGSLQWLFTDTHIVSLGLRHAQAWRPTAQSILEPRP